MYRDDSTLIVSFHGRNFKVNRFVKPSVGSLLRRDNMPHCEARSSSLIYALPIAKGVNNTMKLKNLVVAAIMSGGIFSGQSVLAHTTVVAKNTPNGYALRAEMEGTSSVLNNIGIAHGCAASGQSSYRAVTAMSIVLPNGADAIVMRADTKQELVLSENIIGNAIMSAKPVQDRRIFSSMAVKKGDVPEYYSHGTRTTDVTAIHYWDGHLDPDFLGLLPFRASFPKFKAESCAIKMKAQMAIANYCTGSLTAGDRADVWMGSLTGKFDDEAIVSVGFWPAVTVVRDLENNPLPADCGEGFELLVSPSAGQIDALLPLNGYWPAQ